MSVPYLVRTLSRASLDPKGKSVNLSERISVSPYTRRASCWVQIPSGFGWI